MADKKISELDAITGANTAATDVFVVVDTSTGQTKKITREELNNAIERDVLDSIDIDTINGDFTVNGNINLGDGNKAIFGAGNDLQIYHDGSHSIIQDAGTGDLILQGGNDLILRETDGTTEYLRANEGAGVQIYHNGNQKLLTTSTGIDVNGTVTADGLTVDGSQVVNFTSNTSGTTRNLQITNTNVAVNNRAGLYFQPSNGIATSYIDGLAEGDASTTANRDGAIVFGTRLDGTFYDRAKISSGGDISFYEDTGTTAKLFWDASAEALGIGTSSPSHKFHVSGSNSAARFSDDGTGFNLDIEHDTSNGITTLQQTNSGGDLRLQGGSASGLLLFDTGGSERMRIDNSGNVGINRTSPNGLFHMQSPSGTDSALYIQTSAATDDSVIHFGDDSASSVGSILYDHSTDSMQFETLNSERMRITSGGLVGIGTDSPSYQTHIKGTGSAFRLGLESDGLITGQAFITDNSGSPVYASISSGLGNLTFAADTGNSYASSYMDFQIDGSEKARLTSDGRLGLGTSSPANQLHIASSGAAFCSIRLDAPSNTTPATYLIRSHDGDFDIRDVNNSATRMTIDSAGQVGIGTSSPAGKLDVLAGGDQRLIFTTLGVDPFINAVNGGNTAYKPLQINGSQLQLMSGGSERARLDASGNLLVGQSSTTVPGLANTTTGLSLTNNGYIFASKADDNVAWFNRNTSDGSIISLRKDGSLVGSIGTVDGDLNIYASASGHKGLRFGNGFIAPTSNSTTVEDATTSLGLSTHRFKNLYLSGGVYVGGTTTANKLEDYEEGTWTPTNAGDATGTISGSSAGQYTKVGRFVHVQGQVNITANFTGASIGGLPFTPRIESGLSNVYGAFIAATTAGSIYMTVTDAGTNINLYTNAVNVGLSPSTAYGTIRFAVTYETNA